MKILHILFAIADNKVSGEHLHVLLDEELPADTKLWSVLLLPEPYYVTGVRSPASRYVTVQKPEETTRAERAARNLASHLQGVRT